MKITALPEQIRPYIGSYRTYPVSAEMMSDMRTPIEVLRALQKISGHVYMLESVSGHEKWGRYTFLGYDPKLEISCFDGRMKVGSLTIQTDDPGQYIRQVLAENVSPKIKELPPFTGGLVGYFSYDYLKYAEPTLHLDAEDSEGFRDVDLMLFDKVICFDNYRQKMILIVNMELPTVEAEPCRKMNGCSQDNMQTESPAKEGAAKESPAKEDLTQEGLSKEGLTQESLTQESLSKESLTAEGLARGCLQLSPEMERSFETAYNKAVMELQNMEALIKKGDMAKIVPGRMTSEVRPLFSEDQFCGMVEKAKKHIFEGDIFQVVLSNRLEADYEGSLLNTYRILRTVNPSPYMFYFASSDLEVAGASPETLVKLEDGVLHTFPLAGTRPRGKTDEEDAALEKELLADAKELAEHSMLVDLGRNDIGKISEFGSVTVEKSFQIERYSHVMHIASTVRGQIRPDYDAVDSIASILPAGTLSGAPKIRAAQIINDLENNKRGIYGGALGYLSLTGNMDMCIAIRIAYKKNGKVFVRSGAGIVADSEPKKEYQECLNKARAVMVSLQRAQEELSDDSFD